jgi:hypothetical protein
MEVSVPYTVSDRPGIGYVFLNVEVSELLLELVGGVDPNLGLSESDVDAFVKYFSENHVKYFKSGLIRGVSGGFYKKEERKPTALAVG